EALDHRPYLDGGHDVDVGSAKDQLFVPLGHGPGKAHPTLDSQRSRQRLERRTLRSVASTDIRDGTALAAQRRYRANHCRMVLARLHSRNRAKHHGFRGPAPALTVARGLLAPDCERLAGNSRVDADDLRVRTDVQYQ